MTNRSEGDSAEGGGAEGGGAGGSGTADDPLPDIGAAVTDWLAKLGAIGIPGFLLIVLILWLWERWTRAEEG